MGKSFFNRAMTYVVAFFTLVAVSSCVNSDYELSEENMDMNVTLFQEGVSLPLGSIKMDLETLYSELDEETREMLRELDGAYMFNMSDNVDMTSDIQDALSGIGDIEAISFDESFSFSLSSVDLSSLEIQGQTIAPEIIDLSAKLEVPDINGYLPKITETMDPIAVSVPRLESDCLDVNFSQGDSSSESPVASLKLYDYELATLKALAESEEGDVEYTYEELKERLSSLDIPVRESFSMEPLEVGVPVEISLPKEIKEVKSIRLKEGAAFEMIVQVVDPLFTSGTLTPVVDVDLHELFHIDGITQGDQDGGHIGGTHPGESGHEQHFADHVYDNFVLTPSADPEKNWRADHIYHVDSLMIKKEHWTKESKDSPLVLSRNYSVTMNGELERSGLKTTFRRLYESARDEKVMKVKVEVRMIDLAIDDVVMVMEPVELNKSLSMPLEIAGLTLPDMVEKVEYVAFSDDADKQLKLNIDAVVPEFDDSECHMDIVLDPLNIVFPEGVVVDHDRYDGQQLSYNNQSIVGGFSDVVRIEKMYLPEPVGNVLSYSGNVEVTAKAVATGVLNSKSLMSSEKNVSVGIEVKYEPELSDYSVVIADYNYELSDIEPVEIEASLGKDVGEMLKDNTINVSLKQEVPGVNPKILIEIDYPEHDAIRILPAVAGGLKIDFPDLLVFAQSSVEEYGVNTADNSIHFEGDAAIPHSIELEIEKIKVNPEYSEEKDDYLLLDRFEVTGGVRLAGSTIDMKTVQELVAMDVKVGFKAQIPTLAPDKIGMDEYFVSISEKIAIEGMQIELPEMVESIKVSEILLKDVVLDLVVDVESVSEIVGPEAVLTMTADITLPDMLMVEGVGEDGILHMEKSLDAEGRIAFDPVKVVGLNLSGVETVEGKLSVADQEITVNGSISFSNISIDMDELKGKDLEVSIVGSLSSKGEDGVSTSGIDIERIEGYVGFGIDPVTTSVDLSELASVLDGDNVSATLDLNTFWLTLDVDTNIDIPVVGSLVVTPFFKGAPGQVQNVTMEMDWEKRGEDGYKFFISNTDPASEEAAGKLDVYKDYDYVNLDLISMLYSKEEGQKAVLADSLQIALEAGVDAEKKSVIEPHKEYKLGVAYELGVPLELGEDFAFEYRDTLSGLSEMVSQLLAYGSIGLGGEITNALPLRLDLQIRLLDSKNEVVPMKEGAGSMVIASCDAKGRPVTTPIDLVIAVLEKNVTDLSAIELVFRADAGDAAGVALRSDSFLQVMLSARVPEGVTLDLGEVLADSGNESEEDNQ